MIERLPFELQRMPVIQDKVNEIIDAVNELFNRIEPPTVYRVMKERDELIAKHIGEKNKLQTELDRTKKQLEIAIQGIKTLGEYDPYKEPQSIDTIAQDIIEQITALNKIKDKEQQ